jgi:lipopolysaccharide transport system ATP-binding protein
MSHLSEIIHPSSDLDSDVLIKVNNVSKKFCRDFKKSLWYGLKDTAADILHPKEDSRNSCLRQGEFWANQDISFEVRRGECLGLIGCNGAGKTTLLKLLNGLMKPDTGSIEMHGRVGALIALGAGFNPILTGRENIYVNGSILGLHKKEIDAKLDEIVDFAEMEDAIDAPVRTYSSGMQVRLGFAVATTMNPDVLILDEVLAVGDASFRAKCYNRIGKIQKNAAVIFVSHQMSQISQVCDSSLLLIKGKAKYYTEISDAVAAYTTENQNQGDDGEKVTVIEPPLKAANLTFSHTKLEYGGILSVRLELDLLEAISGAVIRIPFYNNEGDVVAMWNSNSRGVAINLPAGKSVVELKMGPMHLDSATYQLALVLNDASGNSTLFWSLKNHEVSFRGRGHGGCEYQVASEYFCIHQ